MSNCLYSNVGYRAKLVATQPGMPLHWLFLPGGPGLGSESFGDLCQSLRLAGNTWCIDYPNDGSNQDKHYQEFNRWKDGLVDLLKSFNNIILVAHSFSGMFVLSDPRIEKYIKGLVLLNTSPNANWMQEIPRQAEKYHLPNVSSLQEQYQKDPSDALFKKLTLACAPYFFSESTVELGKALLQKLPYSHTSYDWAGTHFHPHYEAQWIPEEIPALIMGSEYDHITPLSLFQDDERWQRNNIQMECLSDVGHFPWVSNGNQIKSMINDFVTCIDV